MVKFIKDHKPAVKTAVVGSVVFLAIEYGLDNLPWVVEICSQLSK